MCSAEVVYDDLDHHISLAGSLERACVPMGMYLAWCANLHLVSQSLQHRSETLLLRLRYREVTGSELLVAGCGGRFTSESLNQQGKEFTDSYYESFLDDFRTVFGEDIYDVKDNWTHYDRLSPVLTRRFMQSAAGASRDLRARDGRGRGGRWWKFWS
jgi:hypothetical protein